METTKVQKYILFALGHWYEQAGDKLKDSPVDIVISKSIFIEALMKAGLANKKERALYKNLEELEKNKLIKYENMSLELTPKGVKLYLQISSEIKPYVSMINLLDSKNPLSYTRKAQTVFRKK